MVHNDFSHDYWPISVPVSVLPVVFRELASSPELYREERQIETTQTTRQLHQKLYNVKTDKSYLKLWYIASLKEIALQVLNSSRIEIKQPAMTKPSPSYFPIKVLSKHLFPYLNKSEILPRRTLNPC